MGGGEARETKTELGYGDSLPACFQIGSDPGGEKVFELCEFVMGDEGFAIARSKIR